MRSAGPYLIADRLARITVTAQKPRAKDREPFIRVLAVSQILLANSKAEQISFPQAVIERFHRVGRFEYQAIFDPRFCQCRSPAFFTNPIKRGSERMPSRRGSTNT
jgi:hypothetical protein